MKNYPVKIIFHEHLDMPLPNQKPGKHVMFFRKDDCLVCCGHPETLKILKEKLRRNINYEEIGND